MDLKGLKMILKKYNIIIYILFYILNITNLSSNDNIENILSENIIKKFDLNRKKNQQEYQILKKDWLNPIRYNLNNEYKDNIKTLKSSLIISQPIFKSGGIYTAIKYANSVKQYSNIISTINEKFIINKTFNILLNINRQNLIIRKQKLLIKNSEIDVNRKKEEVINGILNTSYLDNAILDKNNKKNTLLNLLFHKIELINEFKKLSNKDYRNIKLEKFTIINKEKLIENTLNILKETYDIKNKYNLKDIISSNYLPSINLEYIYTKTHDDGGILTNNINMNTYGISFNIQLDTKMFNNIESYEIDYLKAKLNLQDIIKDEKNFFDLIISKIEFINEKKYLAKDDFKLYESLLKDMIISFKAGLNSQADVNIIKNSKNIKSLDIKIFDIDKQIEIIKLYQRVDRI